jgi:hypothetical protein
MAWNKFLAFSFTFFNRIWKLSLGRALRDPEKADIGR